MEFRLLGPLEVLDDDGVPVALGGPRPRALLAQLLLQPNEAVSTDRLIDGIWGESPPARPLNALQVHVHALPCCARRRPDRDPRARIPRARRGRRARRRALRAARRRRQAAGGAGAVARACARGSRRTSRSRSSRLRGSTDRGSCAIEARIAADLDAGRHADRRSRARGARRRAPSPRAPPGPADGRALPHRPPGRRARGVPGRPSHPRRGARHRSLARVRELEQQILRHDPALAPAASEPRPAVDAPAAEVELVGRALEVAAICSLLDRDDTRLVTLTGPGGTGKTSLALAVARGLAANEAVVVDLGPISDPGLVATAIAKALGDRRGAGTRRRGDARRTRSSISSGCSCSTTSSISSTLRRSSGDCSASAGRYACSSRAGRRCA